MTTHSMRRPHDTHRPPVSPRAARLFSFLVVALVVAGAAVVLVAHLHRVHAEGAERQQREEARDRGERIRAVNVATTPLERTLQLPGDVHGYEEATLYAKVSGYVRDVRVERGQRVQRGEVLATIDAPENERDVAQAEHDYALAQINSRRFQTLAPSGVVSNEDRDNAVTQAKVSRAMLGRAQDILAYTIVRAPFDGIVTARDVDPGALVPAATGATESAQPLFDVADTSAVRIFTYVGQDAAPFVHPGDAVTVWQDELPTRRIPAAVSYATGALDPRTRTMQVEVDVPNTEWNLQPGTFAHVEIDIEEPPSPLLPDEAIAVRQGKTQVVLVKDGKAHYVDVDLGYNDGAEVRVLRGLQGGETVGLDVPVEVLDGSRVQVASSAGDAGAG